MRKIFYVLIFMFFVSCSSIKEEKVTNNINEESIKQTEISQEEKVNQVKELLKKDEKNNTYNIKNENKDILNKVEKDNLEIENELDLDTNIEDFSKTDLSIIEDSSDEEIDELINIIFKDTNQ